jgi:hypothetical protein
MTEREQLIEAMRGAIRAQKQSALCGICDRIPHLARCQCQEEATAALSALLERYAVVPREPTVEMLQAAQNAWLTDPERKSSTILRAALEASPIQHEGEQ